MAYPMEVYRNGESRVMFGPEEHAEAKKDGWSDERQRVGDTVGDVGEPAPRRRGRPPVVRINEVA